MINPRFGIAVLLGFTLGATSAAWSQTAAVAPPKLGGYLIVRETVAPGTWLTGTIHRARLSAERRAGSARQRHHRGRKHRVRF